MSTIMNDSKISIAICDDEKNIRDYLSVLIKKQGALANIKEYASAEEYLSSGEVFDLLFLDVELMDEEKNSSMNGMVLAEKIRENSSSHKPLIIFVSGHEEYVYTAFDVNAFAYLLKPIDENRFSEVFHRAAKQIFEEKERSEKVLLVSYQGAKKVVPLHRLLYAESANHKVILHLENESITYYEKLEDLERKLGRGFYRIHRSYLINLSFVEAYNKTEVIMEGGERLLISKYRYHDFVKAYMSYIT